MAKNLVIVESPAKAKTIEGFLGKDLFLLGTLFWLFPLGFQQIQGAPQEEPKTLLRESLFFFLGGFCFQISGEHRYRLWENFPWKGPLEKCRRGGLIKRRVLLLQEQSFELQKLNYSNGC